MARSRIERLGPARGSARTALIPDIVATPETWPMVTEIHHRCHSESRSIHQFVEKIVIEEDGLAGTGAFDVLDEIGRRIIGTADQVVPDSSNDRFKLLLLPRAVVGCCRSRESVVFFLAEEVNEFRRRRAVNHICELTRFVVDPEPILSSGFSQGMQAGESQKISLAFGRANEDRNPDFSRGRENSLKQDQIGNIEPLTSSHSM